MDDRVVSFIICVSDPLLFRNSMMFIKNLIVPEGVSIEIIDIENAESIASGYNEGMKKAKGKYKVYLHQDSYIVNPNFISNILDIFKDDNIGVIGIVGAKKLPKLGVWWLSPLAYGSIYEIRNAHMSLLGFRSPIDNYEEVVVVDGVLIATQYDYYWREDIFDGWHFYDASQCMEFIRNNKKVVIPKEVLPWVIHDCGIVSIDNFEYYRAKYLNEYKTELENYTLE